MAKLNRPFSLAAFEIEAAISEGRTEEAMQKLIGALQDANDNRAVRHLAARWIENMGLPAGSAKALRNGKNALPMDWLNISEMVSNLQSEGITYEVAILKAAEHFGYSDRHVQKCVAVRRAADEASRDFG